MSNYLLLYRSEKTPAEQFAGVTPEQQQQFMQAWLGWDASIGEAMVDAGNPTAAVSDPKGSGDHISGYAIVKAGSPEDVEKLLAGHPHLATGGTVGIYQVMQM